MQSSLCNSLIKSTGASELQWLDTKIAIRDCSSNNGPNLTSPIMLTACLTFLCFTTRIEPTLSFVVPEVVAVTTCYGGANIDDKVGIIITLGYQDPLVIVVFFNMCFVLHWNSRVLVVPTLSPLFAPMALWQPSVVPMTTKLAPWSLSVIPVMLKTCLDGIHSRLGFLFFVSFSLWFSCIKMFWWINVIYLNTLYSVDSMRFPL